MRTTLVVVMMLASGRVRAEPWATETPELKSPYVAGLLPVGVMAAGVGAFALGFGEYPYGGAAKPLLGALGGIGVAAIVVGPSLGHMYAHDTWNGGFRVRLVSAAVFGVVSLAALSDDNHGFGGLGLVGAAAAIPFLGGSLYELFTSPRAACEYNARITTPRLTVAPTNNGLALAGAF